MSERCAPHSLPIRFTGPFSHFVHADDGSACRAETLTSVPLSDDQARELSRAAKQVTTWTERRNRLIREAVEAGAGVREVARACGLNHATVLNILKRKQRGATDA